MSLEKEQICLANDFITLKNSVKKEIQRRSQPGSYGSLSAYATNYYDYTSVDKPVSNGKMVYTAATKIIEPVNAIHQQTIVNPSSGDITKSLSIVSANLTSYAAEDVTSSNHGCQSLCSGLCSSACYSACTSCVGSCSGGCDGCRGCGGACSSSCSGNCDGTALGNCGSLCTGDCTGSCGECGGCGSGCRGSSTSCASCAGTCKTSAS